MNPTLAIADPLLDDFASKIGESGPVFVEGARTRWAVGGEPTSGTRAVTAPKGIVDYLPEEMIVTVRAGTSVSDLHAELAGKRQRTALPERGGTVGGAVAVGENDHRVLGRGTVRSAVLQVRYISADGDLVTGGGPTVKNVTGFDLPRLMTGSLGTLGCLGEFIVRTNPIPETTQWFAAESADPFAAHTALLAPSAVVWNGTTTWVQIEGHASDVAEQALALRAAGSFSESPAPPTPTGHRWSLKPSDLGRISSHDTGEFTALIGVGTVFATKPQRRTLDPDLAELQRRIKREFDPSGRLNPGRDTAAT
ncbi:MAG: FAD-binding protein [Acidimicrobiales bacterium]